jgi:cell filamentation protein
MMKAGSCMACICGMILACREPEADGLMAPFDPFGDFNTAGYLRNAEGFKRPSAVKRLEHREYQKALPAATVALQIPDPLTYQDVLDTHRRMFERVYPSWAGTDRRAALPDRTITKGLVRFANPQDIERATTEALKEGSKPDVIRERPGEIMGRFTFAHPFLEGNGRTILAVFTELARRAEISIEWHRIPRQNYLRALTFEIQLPGDGHLDRFLKPYAVPNPDKLVIAAHQPLFDASPQPERDRGLGGREW